MPLPTVKEIEALHHKYAPSDIVFRDVWEHVSIVWAIAEELNTKNYITHGMVGYKILKAEGYPDLICNFARNHIGVGVTKEDVESQNLPLPVADYTPQTLEERIVGFADKFHSKTTPPTFNSPQFYSKFLAEKFGSHKTELFESLLEEFGEPDLAPIMKRFNYPKGRIR
jgi:uncharacterized protein